VASRGASARRYAEAVFELASERDTIDAWTRDLQTIADFASEPDVARVLESGRIPASEKLRLLTVALEPHVSTLAMNLVKLLAQRNKLHLSRQIFDAFRERADDRRGVAHATVTTAVPLADDERQAIATRLSTLTGKRVDVTPVVDDAIIGGLVARIGDQLIDGSTRTKLIALKRRLASAAG
jgi:F-type H+-transporting ATPase subunit delta